MVYNLNYNPGTELDMKERRRKGLMFLIIFLVLIAIVTLVFLGLRNNKEPVNQSNVLTEEQKAQIIRDLQNPPAPEYPLTSQQKRDMASDLRTGQSVSGPPVQLTEEQKAKIIQDLKM